MNNKQINKMKKTELTKEQVEKYLDRIIECTNITDNQEIIVSAEIYKHTNGFYKGFKLVEWISPGNKRKLTMNKNYHK